MRADRPPHPNDDLLRVAMRTLGGNSGQWTPALRWLWYSHGSTTFASYGMRLPLDTPEAIERANDKGAARAAMVAAGVPTVSWRIIDPSDPPTLPPGGLWAVKPIGGKKGQEVHVGLDAAQVRSTCARLRQSYGYVLLERFVRGPVHRVLVLDGEVIGSYEKFAATLLGDGVQTARELIEQHGAQLWFKLAIDDEMERVLDAEGLALSSVPGTGKRFRYTAAINLSRGAGWAADPRVTPDSELATVALAGVAAVGLRLAGVDILGSADEGPLVLEVNPSPGLIGVSHDPAKSLIDLRPARRVLAATLHHVGSTFRFDARAPFSIEAEDYALALAEISPVNILASLASAAPSANGPMSMPRPRKALVACRMSAVIDPPIDGLNALVRTARAAGVDVVDLGQAVPDFGPPPGPIMRLAEELSDPLVHRYGPDPGLPELREAIALRMCRRGVVHAEAADVLVTAGANHGFTVALQALIEPGRPIALLSPWFLNHAMAVAAVGAEPVEVPIGVSGLADDFEDRVRHIRPVAVVLVNPSNPTGRILVPAELARVAAIAEELDAWVLADEVYCDFTYAAPPRPAASFAPDRTLTFGSFSKSFGASGWRVGWLHAPRRIGRELLKVQDLSIICAPRPSQRLAWWCLDEVPDWPTRHLAEFAHRRQLAQDELSWPGNEVYCGDGGFFAWFCPEQGADSRERIGQIIAGAGVCVTPGAVFGPSWRSWYRLSYGCQPAAQITEACRRLRQFFCVSGEPR